MVQAAAECRRRFRTVRENYILVKSNITVVLPILGGGRFMQRSFKTMLVQQSTPVLPVLQRLSAEPHSALLISVGDP